MMYGRYSILDHSLPPTCIQKKLPLITFHKINKGVPDSLILSEWPRIEFSSVHHSENIADLKKKRQFQSKQNS